MPQDLTDTQTWDTSNRLRGRFTAIFTGLELRFYPGRGMFSLQPLRNTFDHSLMVQYRAHSGPTKHRLEDEQYIEVCWGVRITTTATATKAANVAAVRPRTD